MKKIIIAIAILLGVFCFSKADKALASAHFTTGGSGYMLATMPPPGLFYLLYNTWYQADDFILNNGRKLPGDTKTRVFSQTHRFVWSMDVWVLSGNLMLDLVVPLTSYNFGRGLAGTADSRHFGMGDPYSHLTVTWHRPKFDALLSCAVFFPIGDFREDNLLTSPGKGYWGLQPTAGLTLYFDEAKTWTWSTVIRYEISFKQRKTGVREGDNFHMESSIGKQMGNVALALSTAGSWQVSDSKGKGSNAANEQRTRTFSLGPEVVVGIGRFGNLSLRCLFEVASRNNPEGTMATLTWTIPIFITDTKK
ncbi:MAG: transporter [Deltaproteobacteria bacterium]|jgi:hypothetical protein|nr:transporter [Deltaproteobacteria bacterium]